MVAVPNSNIYIYIYIYIDGSTIFSDYIVGG
jgi:hypothetical protein